MENGRDTAGVIAPPPLIYAAFLGLGFALDALLPSADVSDAVAAPLGIVLLVAGLGVAGAFIREFRRTGTNIDPGRPTTAIVTAGPYRLTRNPGYVGMTLICAGVAILTSTLWAFATLAAAIAVVDRGVIAREERYLERKFGGQYLDYKRRVRRWI